MYKPTVVVKRQAEEGGKRAPDKLRAQRNLKLKTRARLNKRARKKKQEGTRVNSTVKLNIKVTASEAYSLSLRSAGLTRAASS